MNQPARKGLLAFVLRSALGDSTNDGVSSREAQFVLLGNAGQPVSEIFSQDDRPALYLAKWRGRIIAVPEDLVTAVPEGARSDSNVQYLGGWMFGGNYLTTSDSRFKEISEHPIAIYDRREF